MSSCLTYDFTESVCSYKQSFRMKAQGSEARLYYGSFLNKPAVLKERFVKKYRHPELDKSLSVERVKFEVRALAKCREIGVKCPAVYFVDMNNRCIVMELIENALMVKEFLQTSQTEETERILATRIGADIAKMHKADLMHGDLTTSNMLLKNVPENGIQKAADLDLYFIDFGLARKNTTHEDKAVDLYVLERALLSSHPGAQQLNEEILQSYMSVMGEAAKPVALKLEEVRLRGRKRSMIG